MNNDVTVIKLGGSLLDDIERRAFALANVVARWNAGENLVLVHGGGKHIDGQLAKLGIAKRTYAGLRVTDDETLEVVVSVLGGTVNKMLVAELSKLGVRAAGISGADGGTLVAVQHPPIDGVDLGHVGQVASANVTLVKAMLTYGILPVISSIAVEGRLSCLPGQAGSPVLHQAGGRLLNVNADAAAASLAVALRAQSLHFITDVAGVLDADGSVVPQLHLAAAEEFLNNVSGGMRPKLQAALSALTSGVREIVIGEEGGTQLVAA